MSDLELSRPQQLPPVAPAEHQAPSPLQSPASPPAPSPLPSSRRLQAQGSAGEFAVVAASPAVVAPLAMSASALTPAPGPAGAPVPLPAPLLPGPLPSQAQAQVKGSLQALLPSGIRHVAIIMDGNGRWAQNHGMPRIEGHRRGAKSVRDIVRAAREIGLPALTLYAFSEQNWDRPLDEVHGLMQLLHDYVIEERAEIMDNSIRLRAIGNVARLPEFVRLPLEQLMADSAHHRGMDLCLALSYGGRESIAESIRAACQRVRTEQLRPEEIDEEMLASRFQTRELPPVDLIIRTSGERRVSNFLLWESPRAAFVATQTLWPEFRRADLFSVLSEVARTQGPDPAGSFANSASAASAAGSMSSAAGSAGRDGGGDRDGLRAPLPSRL